MAGSTELIAVMDVVQGTLVYKMATGVREIEDLRRGATPSEILLTAKDTAGKRRLFRYDLDEGSMKPAFEWLADVVVDTFSWTPTAHVLTVGHGTTVTLYDDRTGEVKRTFEPATAGTVHPKGRFVALEHEGEEVSVFYQRSWDELPETMRKREQQRAQRMEEGLPDWYPTRVKLPTITFVDLEKDAGRWAVRTFYGTRFAWYPLEDYYGSFLLWGIEGKQLNRNVMLGDMTLNLFRMERGKESREFRRLGSDGSPPAEAAGPEEPAAKLEK